LRFSFLTLNWTLGGLFLLVGLVSILYGTFAGLFLVLCAILLLPPVRSRLYGITKIKISSKLRGILILILLGAFAVSLLANRLNVEKEQVAVAAARTAQAKLEFSRTRHMDFFGVDTWKHPDYVRDNGIQLCVICHTLGASGPRNFGPRCVVCHEQYRDDDSASEHGTTDASQNST
jgi:hypothetical protein